MRKSTAVGLEEDSEGVLVQHMISDRDELGTGLTSTQRTNGSGAEGQ